MFPTRFRLSLATLVLATGSLGVCSAQYEDHCGPFCEGCSELRYFEPVDLDLDCMPVDRGCGYVFGYDKLYWAITGEKTTIGAPGVTYPSEIPYQRNPQDDTADIDNQLPIEDMPQPYDVVNGIQDGPPASGFGWGERIELGYFKDNISYTVGIYSGPNVTTSETYGFLPLDLGNEDGIDIDGDGSIDFNEGTGVIGPTPPGQDQEPTPLEILLAPTLNGFGSVHVNFAADPSQFLGFRDYWIDIVDLDDAGDLDGDQLIVIVGPDEDVAVADGIIDDINGNTANYFILFQIDPISGDLVPIAVARDFGDLHFFNIRFNTLQVRNRTESNGIELMKTHRLDNRHRMVKDQNRFFEIGYGLRFFRMTDDFRFDGITDVMGRVFTITGSENSIIGPQLRVRASRQYGKWSTSLDTRFLFGYNIQNIDQTNGFGDDAVPGGLNNLFYVQPTYSRYGVRDDDFSPFVEFRAETKYQVTKSIALKAGATVTYLDNISRASQVVEYNLVNMGIGETGEQDIFMAGLNFGVEFVH